MKVFVGNLDYNVTEDEVKDFFQGCGDISEVKLIKDYETGRFKGFGFISFDSNESMQNAIQKNGEDFKGRPVRINEAKPKGN